MNEHLAFDSTTIMVMRLATSLLRKLSEHGLSEMTDSHGRRFEHNSFSFSELVGYDDAMRAGKAARKQWIPFCLNVESRLPAEFKGCHVQLSGGRLHVIRAMT